MKKPLAIFLSALAVLFFSACNNNYPAPILVTDIAFEPPLPTKQLSLSVNEAYQLNAKSKPDNATNTKLTYTSDTPTVASVNDKGVITAKKTGQAVITIKAADGVSKTIKITVTAAHIAVTGIVLSPDEDTVSLVKGSSRQLKAQVQPENATNKKLTFASSAPAIASINDEGTITAHELGNAEITIQAANEVSKKLKVIITAAPVAVTDIVFDPALPGNPLLLSVGSPYQLHAKAQPENATDKNLIYSSADDSIASVDDKGMITAHKTGNTKITIKAADGVSKEVSVTVTTAHISVAGIVLSPDESGISLVKGTTRQINAHAIPEDATNKKLTYSSDNQTVASVNAEGLISTHSVGSAKITIKAADGVSKEVSVTVTAAHISVAGIVLSPDESGISLVKGTTRQINAHAIPEDATNKKLTYSSDNQTVASVNADGLITAKAVGNANITIKAANGVSKTIKVSVTAAHVPVTSIIFDPPLPAQPIELVIGQVYKFGAKAMPEEATNRKLKFETSNSSIAWLQGEGNSEVKADGIGEATVTITSDDNPTICKVVHFKMKPKPEIKIKTTPAECESNGGEATFTVETLKGKLDYTPEVVEGGAKWLSVVGKDHTDESTDTVRLTVQTNKTVWNRTACIRFKDNITNEYIKISSKKYLEVKLTQKKNENPNVTVRWVHGITPPKEEEKEKIEVIKNKIPTGTYYDTNYVFYWPETQTTTFFNTRKVDHTHAPNGGYPDGNQCWAKTDANMLHWWFEQNKGNIKKYIEKKGITGNAAKAYEPVYTRGLADNQENIKSSIANLFREKCIDKGGDPANGLQWYLFGLNGFKNAKNKSYSPALFPDVFNKENTPIDRAAIYTKKEFETTLKAALESQKAVGLNRYGTDGTQHAITLWGAAFDEDNNIIAIYVGDNNDVSNKIVPYGIWYKEKVDIYAETEPVIDSNDPHYSNPYFFNYSNNTANDNHYIGQIITLDKGEDQWLDWLSKH